MSVDKLQQKLLDRAVNGRISCKAALELAQALQVDPRLIGELANQLKIKITACQLGCFGRRRDNK